MKTEQVYDSKGRKIEHLTLRDGRYYVTCSIRGQRYCRRIPQDNLTAARDTAAAMIRSWRANGPKAVERMRSESPSVSSLLVHYRTAAEFRRAEKDSPSFRTSENCILSLLIMLREVHATTKPEELNCSAISESLIQKFIHARVTAAGEDLLDRQRARLSATSTVNQARALFSRWAMDYYRNKIALDVDRFRAYSGAERVTKTYHRPSEELIRATHAAAAELESKNPALYLCYILTYGLGLRAGAAAQLRWSWFFEDAGRRFVRIARREEFKPKGREHTMPISDKAWAYLQAHKTDPVYVLPGTSDTGRRNLIGRKFAKWIRSIGWDPDHYSKCAHELRKLFGSEVYGAHGPAWAAEWLGHADVRTTRTYYADPAPAAHPQPVTVV
jgi:integrase